MFEESIEYLDGRGKKAFIPRFLNGIEIFEVLPREPYKALFVMTKCIDCGKPKKSNWQDIKRGNNKGRCKKCCNIGTNNGRYVHGAYTGKYKKLYETWCNMRARCGIGTYRDRTVCKEWQEFIPFRDWSLANGYSETLTIDRIDNDGNYEPSNCQFITREENSGKDKFKLDAKDIEVMLVMVSRGTMQAKIARMLGVSVDTIQRAIKNNPTEGGAKI